MRYSVTAEVVYGLGTIPGGKSNDSQMDSKMLTLTVLYTGPTSNTAEATSLGIIQNFLYLERIKINTKSETRSAALGLPWDLETQTLRPPFTFIQ